VSTGHDHPDGHQFCTPSCPHWLGSTAYWRQRAFAAERQQDEDRLDAAGKLAHAWQRHLAVCGTDGPDHKPSCPWPGFLADLEQMHGHPVQAHEHPAPAAEQPQHVLGLPVRSPGGPLLTALAGRVTRLERSVAIAAEARARQGKQLEEMSERLTAALRGNELWGRDAEAISDRLTEAISDRLAELERRADDAPAQIQPAEAKYAMPVLEWHYGTHGWQEHDRFPRHQHSVNGALTIAPNDTKVRFKGGLPFTDDLLSASESQ
jgi:hypothetical protein